MMRMRKKLMAFLTVMMLVLFLVPGVLAQAKDLVIVLDPGHGGAEAGATRTFSGITYKEEILNQQIAGYCKAELETYAGVKVYLTRTSVSQKAQDRETRINIAKKKKADALVSIHINSTAAQKQTSTTGAFCCVPSTKTWPDTKSATAKEARALAKSILEELNSQVGLKNNGFWIDDELGIILFGQKKNYTTKQASALGISKSILNVRVPSLIVEHCLVNNPNDCKKYLKTAEQLKKMGIADAAGIAKFYGLQKKGSTTGSNPQPEKKKTGVVKVGSALYLYDDSGDRMTGFVTYKGKIYYANSQGKLYTGWKTYKGKKYYFDKTTGAAKTKWQIISKKKYYFSSKGVMQTGLKTIGKHQYYFSSTGAMQIKWKTIAGKRYYFSKVDGRMLKKYWLRYNKKWYYLDKNGNPLKSCTKTIGGKKYKFNSSGVCTNKK